MPNTNREVADVKEYIIDVLSDNGLLDERCVDVLRVEPILSVSPTKRVSELKDLMLLKGVEVAVVQGRADVIKGIVTRESAHGALLGNSHVSRKLLVREVMDRRVCIESTNVTLREAINRFTVGRCPTIVLINEKGFPVGVISLMSIINLVNVITQEEGDYLKASNS